MLVLSAADIERLVDAAALIPVMARVMRGVSARDVEMPVRSVMALAGRKRFGLMPGCIADPPVYGAKLLSLFPDNPAQGRSSHLGVVVLFDAETGLPRACLDASVITALRTAAVSALATDLLARPDATRLAIIGSGEQARAHIAALRAVRSFTDVVIWGRDPARAAACAEAHGARVAASVVEALENADVVCTATAATQAFLRPEMLPSGVHVNAIGGSIPALRELYPECVVACRTITDYRPSLETGAGEVMEARASGLIASDHEFPELGEVLAGSVPGRRDPAERTLYRSLGIAAQDLAAADFIVARARDAAVGVEAPI